MNYQYFCYLFAILFIIQSINVCSLTFRNSYLYTKLVNRVNISEIARIDKTALKFWSFLRKYK
jgi:hypothetical protein